MLNLGKELTSAQVKLHDKPVSERIRSLKQIVPRSRIDAILKKHNPDRRTCSKCSASTMIWFVITLGLFGDDNYRQVFKSLHRFGRKATPTTAALSQARARLGIASLRQLYQSLVKCLCGVTVEGAFYHGMKLIAVDGFVLNLPDTDANRKTFGKPKNGSSEGAFPQVRVLALCEIGSHVLFSFLAKPIRCGEVTMARHLYRDLPAGSLLTFDINFFAFERVFHGNGYRNDHAALQAHRPFDFHGRRNVGRRVNPVVHRKGA